MTELAVPLYDASNFLMHAETKTYSADISELTRGNRAPFTAPLYDDAIDEGFGVLVRDRPRPLRFFIQDVERKDGDILWWTLQPTPETLQTSPNLKGWSIQVFND